MSQDDLAHAVQVCKRYGVLTDGDKLAEARTFALKLAGDLVLGYQSRQSLGDSLAHVPGPSELREIVDTAWAVVIAVDEKVAGERMRHA